MGLESGNFVNDLNASNPVGGTDDINQGDDHLRLIKTVLRNTFIGFTRAFHSPAAGAAKTGVYTILLTDQNALIRGNTTSGGFTITLPLGSVVFAGYEVTIMKSDSSANVLLVDGSGSETINGSANRSLRAQYVSETYIWEGSEWKVAATHTDVASLSIGEGLEADTGALQVQLEDTSISRETSGIKRESTHARKTGDYTALAADNGTLIEMDKASAVTLNLTVAATLEDGWFVDVHNSGAGTLTIDPASSELVDDASTITLATGGGVRIVCDGSAFWTTGRTVTSFAPTFTSSEQTVALDTLLEVAHGLGAKPSSIQVSLICKTTDLGYSVGDELVNGEHGVSGDQGVRTGYDTTNVFIVQGQTIQVLTKSTFNATNLTAGKWRWIIKAWL